MEESPSRLDLPKVKGLPAGERRCVRELVRERTPDLIEYRVREVMFDVGDVGLHLLEQQSSAELPVLQADRVGLCPKRLMQGNVHPPTGDHLGTERVDRRR